VLFTDIVGSSGVAAAIGTRRWRRLLERHHAAVRRELQIFGGREIDIAGDGVFATFASPSDAIGCGHAIVRAVAKLDLEVRVGIHAGECELVDGKPCGLPVHIGARAVAAADPGDVVVTETIRMVSLGLPFRFVDLGTREFASIPGKWRLLRVPADMRGAY
jgi:class 3 adenylate cyclase